jgi:hypothetical protein
MGMGQTGAAKGECTPTSKRQVVQGDCPICPPVRKQNMGPECGCFGQAQGISHWRGILDVK